jgi:hypothetical protein
MHEKPSNTAPSWVPLQKAGERLSRCLGDSTRFTLNQLLTRGRVPVLSVRRDVVGALPDRVEGLLAKASSIDVVSHNNWILAHYRFASEEDAQKVLGPQSCFTWGAPVSGGLIVNLDFDQVQLCWATLIGELRRVDRIPADEAALRTLGLWPGSCEPVDGGDADGAPRGAEPVDDRITPEAGGTSSLRHRLTEWIFDRHQRFPRKTFEALYAEARTLSAQLGEFQKADLLAAYRKVYATEPHRPPATGWRLRIPYSERARPREITTNK